MKLLIVCRMKYSGQHTYSILLIVFVLLSSACRKNADNREDTVDLTISEVSLRIGAEGGERIISVYSDYDWHVLPDYAPWISIMQDGDISLTIVAENNESQSDRESEIHILCNGTRFTVSVRQDAQSYIAVKSERIVVVEPEGGPYYCEVESNILFEVAVDADGTDWVSVETAGNELATLKGGFSQQNEHTVMLKILANDGAENRLAVVYFRALDSDLKDSIMICQTHRGQAHGNDILDGVAYKLQESEFENLNLVVMGDGFLNGHLVEGGLYERSMKQAIEAFFSIPPYSKFRNMFNVYIVGVESETDVIGSSKGIGSISRTKLGTAFGSGTEIVCDDDVVFEYACKAVPVSEREPALIIVVLNSDKYAGTCYMYQDGNAIALCPMSKAEPPYDFDSVVRHEAGGHGFGFLADEYVYYQQQIPANNVQEIKKWQEYGFMMNLDFTSDHSAILWKDFVNLSDYPEVGIYEGGDQYQYGVWRSEENSCMNNNIPYYNIQSRWTIYKRIHQMAGLPYSVSNFLSIDDRMSVIQMGKVQADSCQMDFVPLARPKLVRSSCIEK